MPRFFKKVSKKEGLSPGTLVHIGKKKVEVPIISVIDYSVKPFTEKMVKRIEETFPFKKKSTITWINIDGLHDVTLIEKLGKEYGIHSLVLEDVVNTGQRPKAEEYDECVFIVLKMLQYAEEENKLKTEQVSLVLGKNFVISFQESPGDVFDAVRNRIRNGKGRIRKMGADYLAYALMDAVVDHYFIIMEKIGERTERIEEELLSKPTQETLGEIYILKRELLFMRKSVWPLRETLNLLMRNESKLITGKTVIFLRDVYDHTIQVIDTVETYRDMVSGMLDTYLSSVSNRMNEVMKVLTIIATIFIPLTFIAGIYGMNFQYMPELSIWWAYPAVWAVMIILALSLFMYFKKKGWV